MLARSKAAGQNAEKFCFERGLIDYDAMLRRVGAMAALVLESRLVTTIMEEGTSAAAKRKKVDGLVAKISEYSRQYSVEMKKLVFTRLMSEGMGKLLIA